MLYYVCIAAISALFARVDLQIQDDLQVDMYCTCARQRCYSAVVELKHMILSDCHNQAIPQISPSIIRLCVVL